MTKRALWVALLLGTGCSDETGSETAGLTWYRDVEPIVQAHCNGCHVAGGIGPFVLDAANASGLAPAMAAAVTARTMPPWPPGPDGLPIAGERVLADEQIDTFAAWAAIGAPLGDPADHRDVQPAVTFDPGREPDLRLTLGGADVYEPPSAAAASDEVRCFVIDMPADAPNGWVTALRWLPGQPAAVHHIGGAAVAAASAALARSWYGKDGRPGYECAGGLGDGLKGTAALGASGAGADTGTMMPAGTGIFVPAGSALVVSIHYVLAKVDGPDDTSGIELWLAPESEKAGLRPLVQYGINAPAELPCPGGPASDPADPCSREHAFAHAADPTKVRVINDYLLARCKTTLDAYYAELAFGAADAEHFIIPSECIEASRYEGIVHVVHSHMHTRGASASIEIEEGGSWKKLLDIPKWDWHWEASYLLRDGVPLAVDQEVRVACTYDNGTENQWSMVTGDVDGPRPLEPPAYVIGDSSKKADMCTGNLGLEIPPYAGASYPDVCHEVQARYGDACSGGTADFTSLPCSANLEAMAVLLVQIPADLFASYVCVPTGPGADTGASCADVMGCALACGAVTGLDGGITAACQSACRADAAAYGMAPPGPASPAGGFRFDELVSCGNAECGSETEWQSYLECLQVACTELTKICFAP
jgi:hypothetical protein